MEWKPIETAPHDQRIWAWGDNWHWSMGHVAYVHSDYNGHKGVVCRDGGGGTPFRIGRPDGPTHWWPLPAPPTN